MAGCAVIVMIRLPKCLIPLMPQQFAKYYINIDFYPFLITFKITECL